MATKTRIIDAKDSNDGIKIARWALKLAVKHGASVKFGMLHDEQIVVAYSASRPLNTAALRNAVNEFYS